MKRLVDFFVKRWVLTLSVFGSLMLFGLISYTAIGIDLFPELDTSTIAVTTAYPGAGSQEVVQQVTEPIEDELNTIPGVSAITSNSLEGLSLITVSFDANIDENAAAFEVNQRVNLVLNELPDDATTPNIRKFDPADQPIVNIAVSNPGADLQEVKDYVEDTLQPILRRVDGVADASVVGPVEREIQVLLDPARLERFDLSPQDVSAAIGNSALDLAFGTLEFGSERITLTGRNVPATVNEVTAIPVDTARGLTISDVATVRDTSADLDTYVRVDGEPVVLVEVRKTSGSNSVATANEVRRTLDGINLPEGYTATAVDDTTTFIASTVNSTFQETLIASVAVALVIFLFVGRLGTVFAVVMSIPVAIMGAFITIILLGFTFNIISLLAITIAIGLVVDDGTVVAENVDRLRKAGYSKQESIVEGAGEVTVAVLAGTLSLLAVFIPISFLPGVVGQMFAQFGLTMAGTILISYLDAMFFLTVRLALVGDPLPPNWADLRRTLPKIKGDFRWYLAGYTKPWIYVLAVATGAALFFLLGPMVAAVGAAFWLVPLFAPLLLYLGRIVLTFFGAIFRSLYEVSNVFNEWLQKGYVRSLKGALQAPWLVLVVAGGLFATLFFVGPNLGFQFTPDADSGRISVEIELPSGTSLDQSDFIAARAEQAVFGLPYLDTLRTTVGAGEQQGETDPTRVDMSLDLVPFNERASSFDLVAPVEQVLSEALAPYPEAELRVSVGSITAGDGGATDNSFSLTLASNGLAALEEREEEVRTFLEGNANLRNVTSSFAETTTERVFIMDQADLTGTGLNTSMVYRALRTYNVGTASGVLRAGGAEYDIVVVAEPQLLGDEQAILSLPIYAPALQTEIPIGQLGSFETRNAPANIGRTNQNYSATFSADLAPSAPAVLAVEQNVEQQLRAQNLVDGNVFIDDGGGIDLLGDLVLYAPIAFGLALLLNFLVIASQFNSFRFPLYLQLTVPLALVGVFWVFYLTGTSFNVITILGVMMLVGLVVKNAILLLEVLMERLESGDNASLQDALLEAASLRFRPIMMTTLTVVVISVPLLLGLGEGSEFRYPIGLVILGGVVCSALLTFYVVPAAFYQFERKRFEGGGDKNKGRAQADEPTSAPAGRSARPMPQTSTSEV